MLKISRLADYGMVLMNTLIKNKPSQLSAKQLADISCLPFPTVSKLLKQLCETKLVCSERGSQGGYRLSQEPSAISVADVISAIDGKIALTECAMAESRCSLSEQCELRENWQYINDRVHALLSTISLLDMQTSILSELNHG